MNDDVEFEPHIDPAPPELEMWWQESSEEFEEEPEHNSDER
ncbi:MAG TPA: hypothetical protein VJ753_02340 [Rhizomicrobium sp.]|nr:hypothetical protein [Rhizomicrobium sp.]